MKKQTSYSNQSSKFYFDNPDIWEALRNHSTENEVEFLDKILSKNGSVTSILDVGCGSGVHCIKLSKLGYKTTGIDLNEKMIVFAKNAYPECEFQVGDMRKIEELGFSQKFDALLCLCTTFTYNVNNLEILETLKSFSNSLAQNGLLVIEIFNPISFLEKNKFQGSFFLEDSKKYEDLGLQVDVLHTVNEKRQTISEIKKIYSKTDGKLLKEDRTEFRLWFPQEIKYFLETNGFSVIEQYGRYDENYLDLDKTRIITLAKKL